MSPSSLEQTVPFYYWCHTAVYQGIWLLPIMDKDSKVVGYNNHLRGLAHTYCNYCPSIKYYKDFTVRETRPRTHLFNKLPRIYHVYSALGRTKNIKLLLKVSYINWNEWRKKQSHQRILEMIDALITLIMVVDLLVCAHVQIQNIAHWRCIVCLSNMP